MTDHFIQHKYHNRNGSLDANSSDMATPHDEVASKLLDEKKLQALFCQVSILAGQKPADGQDDEETPSDEEKLRLYGLYKRVKDGDLLPLNPPPIFQPIARSKFFAWKECSVMSTREAMEEYVRILASRRDKIGEECRRKIDKFHESHTDIDIDLTQEKDNKEREQKSQEHTSANEERIQSACAHFANNDKKNDNSISNTTAKWIGIKPLVPRGRLDISYRDLAFGLYHGTIQNGSRQNYKRLHDKIAQLWATTALSPSNADKQSNESSNATSKVLVGLSVRSLFDLYLTMKGYPDDSEVLVVPPISVPGMMYVARYHNLRIVPVDIEHTDGKKDNHERQWIDIDNLKSKVTEKTVAIMVVHPFGIVTTNTETMNNLQCVADSHELEIWEDCAETFTGLGDENYLGSNTHADVRFFSFGTIKTATALGGGIALFKDATTARHMYRLQQSLHNIQQTRGEFFRKAATAIILNSIADSPIRVGTLSKFCDLCGLNLDTLITYSIRGFTLPEISSNTKNQNGETKRLQSYIRQIRKQPSHALMALLHRRLEQSKRMAPSVPSRLRRCKRVAKLLEAELPELLFPKLPNSVHTFWAFPICSSNRDLVCRKMRSVGFDVATGASQLCSVSKFTSVDEKIREEECPFTDSLMNSILYLPICSQRLSDSTLSELVHRLKNVLKDQASDDSVCELDIETKQNVNAEKQLILFATIPVVLVLALGNWTGHVSSTRLFRHALAVIVSYFVLRLCGEYFLRWKTAELYLNGSSAFAEHCDMIDSTYDDKDSIPKKRYSSGASTLENTTGIIDVMDSLRLSMSSEIDVSTSKRRVILTGATGFVGTALLRDLLLQREGLSLDRVILLCRGKGNLTAKSRLESLMNKPIFDFLTKEEKLSLVEAVEGDVTMKSAGLSDSDLARILQDPTISHVIHSAAAVSFTMEFPSAAESNITSSLNMQRLAGQLKNRDVQFLHISTAFVHGDDTGSKEKPLTEELFDFQSFDPLEIYKSMVGTQFYASKAMSELGFPNSYSFSKSVCEHLLSRNKHVNTMIIRPNIVGPAIEAPYEGWAGDRPSTIVAGPCLHLSNQWNVWHLGSQLASCFPVDVLARFVIAKAFNNESNPKDSSSDGASSSDGSFERIGSLSDESSDYEDLGCNVMTACVDSRRFSIYNATWNTRSGQNALFSWVEFSTAYLHLGAVLGYFSRSNAMLQLLISAQLIPGFKPTIDTLRTLQSILIRSPFQIAAAFYDYMGMPNQKIKKLLTFLDLPLLFYPFVTNDFHFQSELDVPPCFDSKRYSFSCGVAAHRFILSRRDAEAKKSLRTEATNSMTSFAVGGRNHSHGSSHLWWAFCQPRGDLILRFVAALVAQVLWRISTVVTVDLISFRKHLAAVRSKNNNGPVHLVLVPTHRSFLDFILLSYVFFSVPELQVNLPFIIAADEFQFLPFIGWLARRLRAFYIQRGKGRIDTNLSSRLGSLKRNHTSASFEVFIEGKRSRDRRFIDPKTGLLKSLVNSGGEHVILPITINYECIPEQNILSEEAAGSSRRGLTVTGMVLWLKDVFGGKVDIGKIHIAASGPLPLDSQSHNDFRQLANDIQVNQQKQIFVSEYHIKAASKMLDIRDTSLEAALKKLGCQFWPITNVPGIPGLPADRSALLTIVLHFGHLLAPLFYEERRKWSIWLCRFNDSKAPKSQISDVDIQQLYNGLEMYFDAADALVDDAIITLKKKDFIEPDNGHIFQTAKLLNKVDVPAPILRAAVSMKFPDNENEQSALSQTSLDTIDTSFSDGTEKLGFWGFIDSGFVAKTDGRGKPYVMMKGTRYALCGKRMKKILPFIESSLKVKINLSKEFTIMHTRWSSEVESDITMTDKSHLHEIVNGQLSFSTFDRLRHGTGHSQEDIFAIRNGEDIRIPDGVVWPSSEEQVIAVVNQAREKNWCLIPYGGGTNVIEATRCPPKIIEPRPILSVSTKHLNRVLWLNEEDGLACVEAGITGRELVEILESRGYTMGHEPDSIEFSTLGGWIATKASGMKRSKYGNIEDIVLSARVVTPDGILWKGSKDQKTISGRHAEGLDVHTLAFGSEGCLGIITSAIIRIWSLPEVRDYGSAIFPRFDDGLQFVKMLSKESNMMPACVRLLDNAHFRLGQALRPEESSWFHEAKSVVTKTLASLYLAKDFDPDSVVCATISYEGSKRQVQEQMATVAKLARIYGGVMLGSKVGKSGYDLTYMIAYLRDFAMTYHVLGESFETFVPWSKIDTLIAATKKRIYAEHTSRLLPGAPFVGCRVTQLYHEGVCLYFYMCISFDGLGDRSSRVYADLERAARDEILKQGGSLSHHHGVGKVRASFAKNRSSTEFQNVVASIKGGMDKDNVFGARNGLFSAANDA